MAEKIFAEDEMQLKTVDPAWSQQDLLDQDGIFFLKDVATHLGIPTMEFKNRARKITRNGHNSWKHMGIRKTWTHWQVRMRVFKPYFESWWTCPNVEALNEDWDTNQMLAQRGTYYLNDVCRKLPFTMRQVRYQMQKERDPKAMMGIWKDHNLKTFVVDMPTFAAYMKAVWKRVHAP